MYFCMRIKLNDRRANLLSNAIEIITSAWGCCLFMFSWKAFKGKANEIMLGYKCLNCTFFN